MSFTVNLRYFMTTCGCSCSSLVASLMTKYRHVKKYEKNDCRAFCPRLFELIYLISTAINDITSISMHTGRW